MEKNNFTAEVIRRSYSIPVLVDFWAPWCGACKVLSPALGVLHERHKGKWVLVKINVEKYPILAERYNVTGIPSVLLFVNGEVVDEFTGAIPGHVIESWLESVLPGKSESDINEAQRLYITGNKDGSVRILSSIIQNQPENKKAKVLYALQTVLQDPEKAMEMVINIEPVGNIGEMAEAVKILSTFILSDDKLNGISQDKASVHIRNAAQSLKSSDVENALIELIEVLKADRNYLDGLVQDLFIALFFHLGSENQLTIKYRKEVGKILYS